MCVAAVGGGISARRMSVNRMPISRGIAPLADIPDRQRRDSGPEFVIRGEHPVIGCRCFRRGGTACVAVMAPVSAIAGGSGRL